MYKVDDKSQKFLVTGGSGYLASWIIKLLLDEGFSVNTTVRDPEETQKIAYLKALDKNNKLTFFKADLLDIGSFKDSMRNCSFVIHTASPFFITCKDPEKELINPAKIGTRNVLQSVNETSSVKRVVLTSSVAAMFSDNVEIGNIAINENNWNKRSSADHNPYNYSKTLAEKEAWSIAEAQNKWDLVVINPGIIFGPSLSRRRDSLSIKTMIEFGNGRYRLGVPNLFMGIVDVRDVAKAHIKACFNPEAKGRHVVVGVSASFVEIAKVLKKKFKNRYPFPLVTTPKFIFWLVSPFFGITRKYVVKNVGYPFNFDNSYSIKDLNMSYRSFEETIIDHFQQIIDDGLLK